MMTRAAPGSAMPATRARDEPTGVGWALWAVASAVPWLLPTHAAPWTTFYGEAMMAAALVPIAAWALWAARGSWRVDVLAAGFLVAAFVPVLQALGGMFSFPAEAPLVGLYLSAFALTLLVARHAEEAAPSRLIDGLFAGLAMAALLSTGIALYQWLGLDTLGVLLAPIPRGDRPVANVGQANNLSTLLVWGLVAIWWAHSRRRIGGAVATLAAAFLLIGVALTQSRTGFLVVGMLGIAALLGRRALRTSGQAPAWFALAVWLIVLVVAAEPLGRMLLDEPTRSLADTASPRQRLMILKMALNAIAQHPWLGYGWNQIVTAHVGMAAQFPMHGTVGNSHNFVLDLILWNGLPLAMLMVAGLCLWFWHALRADSTAEHALLLLGLAVFVLHATLELPHVLAYFLLPAAVMMGTLNARRPIPTLISIPRIAIGLVVLLHATTLLLMFDEYRRIEASAMSARMRAARIGNIAPSPDPEVLVLRSLQDGLLTLRTEPRRAMSADVLGLMRRTVTRYPTVAGLFRYAQASALNGRPDDAKWALRVLCSLHSVEICQAAAQDWTRLAAEGNPELAVVTVSMDDDGPSRP